MTGIYKITNLVNGKIYIGQSMDIEKRFKEHISNCKYKRNNNYALYKAFNKYGVGNFKFEIITLCSVEELDNMEIKFIEKYNSYGVNGYNMTPGGNSSKGTRGFTGRKHTIATKDKISELTKGRNNPFYGRNHSTETRIKISKSKKGKSPVKISNHKKVICITNEKVFFSAKEGAEFYNCHAGNITKCCRNKAKYAGTLSNREKLVWMYYSEYLKSSKEEINKKIRDANKGFKGQYNPMSKTIICLNDYKVFKSIKQASIYYNIQASGISNVCRKKYHKTKGYSFMYYSEYLKELNEN